MCDVCVVLCPRTPPRNLCCPMLSLLSFSVAASPRARVAVASQRRSLCEYSGNMRTIMASASSQPALSYDVNWGPASSLDATVFGACRPGGAGGEERTPAGSISDAAVDAWAQYMRSAGITRVVSLLEAEELTAYATPLETQYARLFKRCVPCFPHMQATCEGSPPVLTSPAAQARLGAHVA